MYDSNKYDNLFGINSKTRVRIHGDVDVGLIFLLITVHKVALQGYVKYNINGTRSKPK